VKHFVNAAGSRQRERSVTKHSTNHGLIHRDRFYLPQEQLQSPPAKNAGLDDHPFCRHGKFGGLVFNECAKSYQKTDEEYASSGDWVNYKQKNSDQNDQPGGQERFPVQTCLIDDLLIWQQRRLNISQTRFLLNDD